MTSNNKTLSHAATWQKNTLAISSSFPSKWNLWTPSRSLPLLQTCLRNHPVLSKEFLDFHTITVPSILQKANTNWTSFCNSKFLPWMDALIISKIYARRSDHAGKRRGWDGNCWVSCSNRKISIWFVFFFVFFCFYFYLHIHRIILSTLNGLPVRWRKKLGEWILCICCL